MQWVQVRPSEGGVRHEAGKWGTKAGKWGVKWQSEVWNSVKSGRNAEKAKSCKSDREKCRNEARSV